MPPRRLFAKRLILTLKGLAVIVRPAKRQFCVVRGDCVHAISRGGAERHGVFGRPRTVIEDRGNDSRRWLFVRRLPICVEECREA